MLETSERTDEVAVLPGVLAPELYSVYGSDETRPQPEKVDWVVKGTDGKFYIVPPEPGG